MTILGISEHALIPQQSIGKYNRLWQVQLSLKNSHEQVESLWVRITDQGNKGRLVVGVYYRPPNQGEPTDEAFLLQLQEASHSQALILLRDFNHPKI